MTNPICIFEDGKYKNLLPLTYFRPVYDLRCGILTIREKIQKYFGEADYILFTREYLANYERELREEKVNELTNEKILFINGRVLPDLEFAKIISKNDDDELFINGDNIVAAKLSGENISKIISNNEISDSIENFDCKTTEIDCKLFEYSWELVSENGKEIIKDIELLSPEKSKNNIEGVHLINSDDIYIGKDVNIKPNVVLDASEGPIFIDDDGKIFPNSYIVGPVYIGKKSLVKANSQIYHDTTIGPVCKVGGEIENSIIHSYSNKQHEGFLGHAYLGSWINIGASSNNSDLKNDYGKIKVILNGSEIDTGLQFVGLIMGDHSKCAINTAFNTGTIVGVSCNIYGAGFPDRYIPSFSWGGSEGFREYHLRKAVEVAKIVKSRRNINVSTADLEVFKKVFELTQTERDKLK